MKAHHLTILAVLISGSVLAQEFDELQIDNATCSLVRSGTDNHEMIYKGDVDIGMCFVIVPTTEFHKTYSYCALSGILASKGHVGCEFGYYDKGHQRVSFVSNKDNLCQFTCIKR